MAEAFLPLLSTSHEDDEVEEIYFMSVSPKSDKNESKEKNNEVNNLEESDERIFEETKVKTLLVNEDRDEDVASEIEEVQLITYSPNSDQDETDVKIVVDETEVITVVSGQDTSELSATDTKPLPPGKEYHIFMSYSSEDRDDANTIRQHLEERFHLKCLYYERDFQIGKNIDENITDGLQKSMKALILLSPFYMQSHWCVTEAREACKLSFTDVENHNVIPVLLRPLSKDLPPFLNSYVYIDAQREMDVAGKIYEACNQSGLLDPLQTKKSALSCNGTLLVRKKAIKANFPNHGLAYRFSPLEAHEEEKISQNGVDPIECKKHVTTVMEDLNNKFLFRNYPVFSSLKWRCLLLCVLSTACSFIWVASFLYIYSKAYMFTRHWILSIFLVSQFRSVFVYLD